MKPGNEQQARRKAGRPVKPLLSAEIIGRAALELMDESGDFTMQQLARRLGVGPSALYNHLAGKEDVLARVRELITDRIDVSAFDVMPFPDALEVWARSYRDAFATHPGTVAVFARTPLAGAGRTTAMYERVVSAFIDAGWPAQDVLTAMVALENFILGAALDVVAPANMFEPERPADAPMLALVIDAANADASHLSAPDRAFEAGLAALLAGVRERLSALEEPSQ